MRRRKAGSVSTKARVGATANAIPRRAAIGAKAVASDSNSGCSAKGRRSGLKAPASSLEMSSSASSSDSTAPRLASILPPRSLRGSRSIIAAVNSRAACRGCRRSWLAAAMKRVLPRLAASASARLASSSAVRSTTRCSSVSAARRSWPSLSRSAWAMRTRAVTSLQVATNPSPGSGSSRSSITLPSRVVISCVCGVSGRRSSATTSGVAPNSRGAAPTATASSSSASRSVKRSLKISSRPSRSNEAMPMPTWSSVLRRIS